PTQSSKVVQDRSARRLQSVFQQVGRRPAADCRQRTFTQGAKTVRILIILLLVLPLVTRGQIVAQPETQPSRTGLGPIQVLLVVVRDVNVPRNQFLLQTPGGEHLFVMVPRCKVKEGVPTSDLRDLNLGDAVSVVYEMKHGMKLAHSVVIHSRATP